MSESVLPNSFYEIIIEVLLTLIPKPGKGITRKENHRPISLVIINAKIFKRT